MITTAEQLGTSERKLHQNHRSRTVNEADGPKHVDREYAKAFFEIRP